MSVHSVSKRISAPSDQELAVAAAILYSSLFDFPLSENEVRQNLLFFATNGASVAETYARSPWLQEKFSLYEGFYFPIGREDWVRLREERRRSSLDLLASHRRLLGAICSLPFTRLVALSGSISHLNAAPGGDLDLMIITEGNHVWSVAVAAILLARGFRKRRTICVNYLSSTTRLKVRDEDLFSASQMIHLRPLIDSGFLVRFLEANPFIREFFPEAHQQPSLLAMNRRPLPKLLKRSLEILLRPGAGQIVEWICRQAYSRYLLSRSPEWKTAEQVTLERDRLKLHSQSHRHRILRRFEEVLIREVGEPDCWRLVRRIRTAAGRSGASEAT